MDAHILKPCVRLDAVPVVGKVRQAGARLPAGPAIVDAEGAPAILTHAALAQSGHKVDGSQTVRARRVAVFRPSRKLKAQMNETQGRPLSKRTVAP